MNITFHTNADKSPHAPALAEIGRLAQGTLLFLQTQKKGVERGRAGAKTLYGDDVVQVLMWTGFSYEAIIERSRKKLDALSDRGTLISDLARAGHEFNVSIADSAVAIQETREWFDRVLAPHSEKIDGEGLNALWEPLTVQGVRVPMCKVYRGVARPGERRAPIPGHIYIQGMKLGEKVVRPAEHGPWHTLKGTKTIAKDLLKSWLPIGLYSQYTLDPSLSAHLVAGEQAASRAKATGIPVDPEAIRKLFMET